MKTCPYCAEQIQPAAKICRFCQRDLATGQSTIPSVVGAPQQPSRGVAAVLSLFIPGVGQIYKGQLGKGFAFLVFTPVGYLMLILPGIILHLIAIGDAAQEERSQSVELERPPVDLTPEEQRKRDRVFRRGTVIIFGTIALSIILGIFLQEGPRGPRASAFETQSGAPVSGDTVYLDAKDWPTKLKAVANRAGESCTKVIATFENGQRSGSHVWSMRCIDGKMYTVTFREGHAATIARCDMSTAGGVPCFEKLGQ